MNTINNSYNQLSNTTKEEYLSRLQKYIKNWWKLGRYIHEKFSNNRIKSYTWNENLSTEWWYWIEWVELLEIWNWIISNWWWHDIIYHKDWTVSWLNNVAIYRDMLKYFEDSNPEIIEFAKEEFHNIQRNKLELIRSSEEKRKIIYEILSNTIENTAKISEKTKIAQNIELQISILNKATKQPDKKILSSIEESTKIDKEKIESILREIHRDTDRYMWDFFYEI